MSAACIEKATVVTHKERFIYLRGSKPACPCCRVILMEKEDPEGGGPEDTVFFCRVWFSPSITAIPTYSTVWRYKGTKKQVVAPLPKDNYHYYFGIFSPSLLSMPVLFNNIKKSYCISRTSSWVFLAFHLMSCATSSLETSFLMAAQSFTV